jgi:hypothetical protein
MLAFDNPAVRAALRAAWEQSLPGTATAHEEGGFVLQQDDGQLRIEPWPRGRLNEIEVPAHVGGRRNGLIIIATFHTHPNPGADFQQEPSLTDIRAVRHDPNLRHREYEGEVVVSFEKTYQIQPDGSVVVLGDTRELLELS